MEKENDLKVLCNGCGALLKEDNIIKDKGKLHCPVCDSEIKR